jgi:hypothetical protein
MRTRSLVSFGALALAVASMAPMPAAAQAKPVAAEAKRKTESKPWTPPLTLDGHPDFQGNWMNRSATPLERPKQLEGRQFLTDAEVAELRRNADRLFKDGSADFPARDDFFLAALANVDHYKSTTATGTSDALGEREIDNRTSLIVDPPNGRLPPYTAEGPAAAECVVGRDGDAEPSRGSEGADQSSAVHHVGRAHDASG